MAYVEDLSPNGYKSIYPSLSVSIDEFINPADTDETNDDTTTYTTVIISGPQLRNTKMLFVPEMLDFYTTEELNTTYHSVDEYANAVKKYGLIYKTKKFDNADTPEKLLDYAKDWVKNNYHGGITSFDITALDMHMLGDVSKDPYLVGKRVDVAYVDPDTRGATRQTLTVISAEYDLVNPDKNKYKIGVPDSALNKTYGESSKSGGGGGGKSVEDPSTDEEVTEDELADIVRGLNAADWSLLYRNGTPLPVGGGTIVPPSERDYTNSPFWYIGCDGCNASYFEGNVVQARYTSSYYLRADGSVDTDKLKANGIDVQDVIKLHNSKVIENSEDGVSIFGNIFNIGDEEITEGNATDLLSIIGAGSGNPVDIVGSIVSGEEFKISDSIGLSGDGLSIGGVSVTDQGLSIGGYTLGTSGMSNITDFFNGSGVSIGNVNVDATWIQGVNNAIFGSS